MTLRAVIFDVDGTLAETEELHRQAFNDGFAGFGLPWVWDRALYRELLEVAGGKERLQHYLDRYQPDGAAALRPHIAALHQAKTVRYAALVASGAMALRPGIARLLAEAQAAGGGVVDAEDDGLINRRRVAQGCAIPVGQEALIGELGRRVVVGRACRRHRSGGEQSCAKEQAEVEFGLLHNIKQLAIILVAKKISVH